MKITNQEIVRRGDDGAILEGLKEGVAARFKVNMMLKNCDTHIRKAVFKLKQTF
jgi:hypothetical protein